MYTICLTYPARQDATEIFSYIAERNPENAEKWFSGFWDAVDSLMDMPRGVALLL